MADAFECPYCGRYSPHDLVTESLVMDFEHVGVRQLNQVVVTQRVCLNPICSMETIHVKVGNRYEYGDAIRRRITPDEGARNLPAEVPRAIASDYAEASSILTLSPNAAAALARRALQGMIRDFWDVKKKTLYDEIDALKNTIDAALWEAMDALRKAGNVGTHMSGPVDSIVAVEPDEANALLDLIETLSKEWYVARARRQALLERVTDIGRSIDERKSAVRVDEELRQPLA